MKGNKIKLSWVTFIFFKSIQFTNLKCKINRKRVFQKTKYTQLALKIFKNSYFCNRSSQKHTSNSKNVLNVASLLVTALKAENLIVYVSATF